jgi:DNA-binding transcriptional ArsR family regulator
MPYRTIVTKELAELFGVLAHPHRIRIVEELQSGEKDVGTMAEVLQISHSGVSQHLSVLRAHRLLVERKQGRNVYYHLRQPALAAWVLEGLKYAGPFQTDLNEFESAVEKAKAAWRPNRRT